MNKIWTISLVILITLMVAGSIVAISTQRGNEPTEAPDFVTEPPTTGGTQGTELPTTQPTPTEPTPTEPAPTEPAPTEPTPTEPTPTEPAPTEPTPTEPAPTEPTPTEPTPTEPAPTEPAPTEPAPTEPVPTEPAPTEPAPTQPPRTEPKASDFTVYDAAGNAVKLSDYFGKPIVLNFWASWCSPCKMEMPEFQQMYEALGQEVHFLMVNLTGYDSVSGANAVLQQGGYTFPVLYDLALSGADTYGITAFPTTVFIDAEGYVMAKYVGAMSREALQYYLDMIR